MHPALPQQSTWTSFSLAANTSAQYVRTLTPENTVAELLTLIVDVTNWETNANVVSGSILTLFLEQQINGVDWRRIEEVLYVEGESVKMPAIFNYALGKRPVRVGVQSSVATTALVTLPVMLVHRGYVEEA